MEEEDGRNVGKVAKTTSRTQKLKPISLTEATEKSKTYKRVAPLSRLILSLISVLSRE
jgi:hypothetical protein